MLVDENLMRRSILRMQSFLFHIPCGGNLISTKKAIYKRPSAFPWPIQSYPTFQDDHNLIADFHMQLHLGNTHS